VAIATQKFSNGAEVDARNTLLKQFEMAKVERKIANILKREQRAKMRQQ